VATWTDTPLTRLLGVDLPLIAAPMAGGPTTPALVVAASRAGALGSLACGYLGPGEVRDAVRAVRAATDRPFAVNLFLGAPAEPTAAELASTVALLQPWYDELGLGPVPVPDSWGVPAGDQLDVLLEERVPVVSTTFGLPSEAQRAALDRAGCLLVPTVTSVAEAVAAERAGADAVCAQGAEAGGHRGTFLPSPGDPLVGLVSLLPQVRDAVGLPLVAAGGIADGRGVAAALALGADGIQLGTALLRAPEAGTSDVHRAALAAATDDATVVTRAYTGRPARGLVNRFAELVDGGSVAPYPVTHLLTAPLRREAARQGRTDVLSLWSGQSAALADDAPAADVLQRIVRQTGDVLDRLGRQA
jgi:nitronate monooxygenase